MPQPAHIECPSCKALALCFCQVQRLHMQRLLTAVQTLQPGILLQKRLPSIHLQSSRMPQPELNTWPQDVAAGSASLAVQDAPVRRAAASADASLARMTPLADWAGKPLEDSAGQQCARSSCRQECGILLGA